MCRRWATSQTVLLSADCTDGDLPWLHSADECEVMWLQYKTLQRKHPGNETTTEKTRSKSFVCWDSFGIRRPYVANGCQLSPTWRCKRQTKVNSPAAHRLLCFGCQMRHLKSKAATSGATLWANWWAISRPQRAVVSHTWPKKQRWQITRRRHPTACRFQFRDSSRGRREGGAMNRQSRLADALFPPSSSAHRTQLPLHKQAWT